MCAMALTTVLPTWFEGFSQRPASTRRPLDSESRFAKESAPNLQPRELRRCRS